MRGIRNCGFTALLLLGVACASNAPRRTPQVYVAEDPPIAYSTKVELRDLCPLDVPDSTVRAEDDDRGAALAFTTTGIYGGDVAEVRRRVRQLADMKNHYRDWLVARMPDRATLPPARRYLEDMPNGAKIVFEAGDETTKQELRARVRTEAVRLRGGMCPIAMPLDPKDTPDTRIVTR
jgi:hypothetical protein